MTTQTSLSAQEIQETYQQCRQALNIKWLKEIKRYQLTHKNYAAETFDAQSGWYQTLDAVKTLLDSPQTLNLKEIQIAELKGEQGSLHIRPNQPPKLYTLQANSKDGEYLGYKQTHQLADQKNAQAHYIILTHKDNPKAPKYSIFDGIQKEGEH